MRKLLLLAGALLFAAAQLLAQQRTVTGKVTDANGAPIPNASVVIKGTTTGTTTDANGNYTLPVQTNAKTLVISSVGLSAMEVNIGNKAVINASLQSAERSLSEVVVVGYGTQQKKAFTGSSAKVDVKEFANLMSPSVDKQLAGRAPGVQVTNSGGSINTPARIRIRGIASITGNNDPLIVVDGTPVLNLDAAGVGHSNTLGDINPNDIETIDVLKDGSATAIYGSRAAAGVILITTKKGVRGRAKVSYDATFGFSSVAKKFDLLNAKQFELIANEKLTNAGQAIRAGVNASADTSDTDWQKAVMNNNAFVQTHTLSVQGGSDKTTYYLSLNFSDQKGIIVSNRNRAYRIRMNLDHELNKFIKIGNNLSITRQEDFGQNEGSNALGGSIASTLRLLPNVSPYAKTLSGYNINYPTANQIDKGPNGSTIDDNFGNTAYILRTDKYYSDKYRIIDNAFMEASIVKGLKLRTQVGIDMLNDYAYQGLNPFHGDSYGKGENYNVTQNWLRLVWSNYFNYNLSVKGHNFFLTGGNEVQKQTYKWFSADGAPISDPFFVGQNIISNSNGVQSVGGNYDNTGFTSLFGRFNYDYKSRYFVQASIRRDGQSSLAPGKKYGTFPGYSIGWRPSQEAFWQNSPGLSNLFSEVKIKGSYAKVGNALGGYPYLTTFGAALYGNLGGLAPSGVGNPDLQWETSAKYDIGIELSLFKNRLNFTADWFLNDVDNLVLNVPQPLSAGLVGSLDLSGGTIPQNIGKLNNRGIELSLSGSIIKSRDFNWDFNVNYSKVKNKITSLYNVGGQPVASISNGAYNIIRAGDPINIIYGYVSAGVNPANGNAMWQKADGSLVQYNTNSALGTVGNFYLADKTTGAVGAASSLAATDKVNLGVSTPTWYGAFSNTFSYKQFGLDFMFRYSGGNKIMNYTRQEALFNMSFQNNGKEILNRWTAPGQVTDVPRLYYGLAANMNATSNATSRFVEKGDYLRLQNIVLSYAVNAKSVDQWTNGYVKSVKIYAQAQNVYVWTKYKGADPDNISALGVDAAVAPQIRTISFGLSVGF
ncbi:MAG TPA: TonB-dependent receptor [Chitinophagaceae bacterium]|nr:TonB-dependent receptor [Chitinophagaceae bacterium]